MISKEEFEIQLQSAKDKGGKHVCFEVKDIDGDRRDLLCYDTYEKFVDDMKSIGFQ